MYQTKGDSMREKYQNEIERRIDGYETGYSFTAFDFLDIADIDSSNKALSRLAEFGKIRRIIKGVYDKPIYSPLLKEYSAPSIESIASALARKFNWTIAPTGETALNYLHMSTQVSNRWSYISDGPYRIFKIEPFTLEFKHCANKEITGRSYITIVAIQAIKAIGKDNIQKEDILRLRKIFEISDKNKIVEEARNATSWVYKIVREACL